MRIRPAHTEGTDAGAARSSISLPRDQLSRDIEGARREIDGRIGGGIVHCRHDCLVLHREDRLDQPGDSGRAGEVAEIRFHRADAAIAAAFTAVAEHFSESGQFDGVPRIVPVPCASTYPNDSADTPAMACAARIAAACPRVLGAV